MRELDNQAKNNTMMVIERFSLKITIESELEYRQRECNSVRKIIIYNYGISIM